ncbi:hypothetical protein CAOG_01461 [Capsaspora owczarzaki ATCC 30864]|uniref:Uncharacterized protein n=1 Tax=Capsaspora owczarzaki (strain ATCC 30864) TaxID=595528 RepID=A0A0D2U4R6_CAPO3|nr:hypothetical protein CAOG_01461 [Capsaspora owczarzaki ATCC 30864]KJE90111.1 hypothetical protein CAOG_001461 [Capsaspora owczarzaki ATCC 30864]|eukprot:XP_004364329.1 hypothetical protein CAOG_01461 [Capsaspora owczarzaki ATCC 30864]
MSSVLKDPLARQEAWRSAYSASKNIRQMLPGFGLGLSAFMLYVAVDEVNERNRQRAAAAKHHASDAHAAPAAGHH